ncbi:MAG: dCTP deaminase, partial [Chloroflexota bacterium]
LDPHQLSEELRKSVEITLDLIDEETVARLINELGRSEQVPTGQFYTFKPHTFVLAQMLERFALPNDIAGRIEGRSTFARLGISVHQTAHSVKPTWSGHLTLEMYNTGPFACKLYPELQRPAQLILERMGRPVHRPDQSRWENR